MRKEIFRLTIPNIITNITIPLLGIVDLALLGHLNSHIYLGAVSIGAMIFNILYWGMNFLRMSTTGFTAQAFGKKDTKKIASNLISPVIIGAGIGILLIFLQYPIDKLSFYLLNAEQQTEKFASNYFAIRIWAAPATLALYGFYGWFIGVQNAKYPMIIAISINIVNIALSYFFIYNLRMNSDGAAIGTVIAQYFGILLSIIFIFAKYKKYFKNYKLQIKFNKVELSRYFAVNANIFVRTLGIMAVFTFFTGTSANSGTLVLDANTILFQFYIFFSYFIDGFAYATEALTGKYLGEQNKIKLIKAVKVIFKYSFLVSIAFTLVYYFLGEEIIKLMSSQKEVINLANKYLFWTWLLPILSFASFIWDGAFVGITASKEMRNTMLFSSVLVFFPAFYLLQNHFGNHALWVALLLFLFSRGGTQTLIFAKILQKNKIFYIYLVSFVSWCSLV